MSTDVAVYQGNQLDVDLIRRTIAPKLTQAEFDLFIAYCKRTGLDPIARQIYPLPVWDNATNSHKMSVQTSIDGFRLLAERSGKYEGQIGPLWCDESGEWRDVWTDEEKPPVAAKVGVYKAGFREPLYAVAHYRDFVKKNGKTGAILGQWQSMPAVMIAKVAESHAIRRAFPAETSGVYTREEMMQADNNLPAQVLAQETTTIEEVTDAPASNGHGQPEPPADAQTMDKIRAFCRSLHYDAPTEPMTQTAATNFLKSLQVDYRDKKAKAS